MSGRAVAPRQAGRIVEARLGRAPQDMLEAAVALEAWVGVRAGDALELGSSVMRSTRRPRQLSAAELEAPRPPRGVLAEAVAFVVAVLAVACWAAPLVSSLGRGTVAHALLVALPLTLGLQWGLRSRYLSRPRGMTQIARARLLLSALALVGTLTAALGLTGLLAALLTVIWVGGTLLIRRRWEVVYGSLVVAATLAMVLGLTPLPVVALTAAATCAASLLAVGSAAADAGLPPGAWWRAGSAALIGAGLGLVLVADPSVGWGMHGSTPAIALLPSTIASFWGGYRLWRFQDALPRSLAGVGAFAPDGAALARPAWRVVGVAVAGLVAVCTLLSAVLLVAAAEAGVTITHVSVLVGFGLVALATLLVSLLEAVGRRGVAVLAVAVAVAAEAGVRLLATAPHRTPGQALIAGATLAVLIALPAIVAMLRHPTRTLATVMWIP